MRRHLRLSVLHSLPVASFVIGVAFILVAADGNDNWRDYLRVLSACLSAASALYCVGYLREVWAIPTSRLMWMSFTTLFAADTGLVIGNIGETYFKWYATPMALLAAAIFFAFAVKQEDIKNGTTRGR